MINILGITLGGMDIFLAVIVLGITIAMLVLFSEAKREQDKGNKGLPTVDFVEINVKLPKVTIY